MKHKLFFPAIIIAAFTISNCSLFNDEPLNGAKLREMVVNAIEGDHDANIALKGLIDKEHIGRKDFNSLSIDSTYINKKFYYSVLLEYFDPLLNIFAVYDDNLGFLLLDKSLNGNLSAEWTQIGTRNFIFVQEKFLTKDIINIDRLSIYELYDTTASLIYRSLSKLVADNQTSQQSIEKITDEFIITKIQTRSNSQNKNLSDTFFVDTFSKKYISRINSFNKFVKLEVKNFIWVTTKPQIPAELIEEDKLIKEDGFQILLSNDWQKISSYKEENLLKRNLTGTKFTNRALNTSITILEVPNGQSGDDYSHYELSKSATQNYKIRSTDIYTMGDNINQLIEHSCQNKTYLLLLDCPKNIYDENKSLFDAIIKSFYIDC